MKKSVILAFFVISTITLSYFGFYKKFENPCITPIDAVYHGSVNRNIKIFEPRAEHVRDPDEGSVVFATPSVRIASCYLFRWDDSWVHQFISWNNNDKLDYEVFMVISDKERFRKEDSGGSIYLMPAHGFTFDKNKGVGIYEWTNKKKVLPFTKINFSSALEAMKTFHVKVYFVNSEQFRYYINLPFEERESFLLSLK